MNQNIIHSGSDCRRKKHGAPALLISLLLTLCICQILSGQETRIRFETLNGLDLSDRTVFCVLQDSRGFIWLGTEGGLLKYDGYSLTPYTHIQGDSHSLSHNYILSLCEDSAGVLWVGTFGGGLNRYDRDLDRFVRYSHNTEYPGGISNNFVWSIFEDREGTLWIGTSAGLNKLGTDRQAFTVYQNAPDNRETISDNTVWSIFEDQPGTIWLGTSRGLNRFDRNRGVFEHFLTDSAATGNISNNEIRAIAADRFGNLWIGTSGGLNRFDAEQKRFKTYLFESSNPRSLSHNQIRSICLDKSGVLWIGTSGGLNRYDQELDGFTAFRSNSDRAFSIASNDVYTISEDQTGILWIGTTGGVNKVDREKIRFTLQQSDPTVSNSLSHNMVLSIFQDRAGLVWAGTWGGGLNRWDRRENSWTIFRAIPGNRTSLSDDQVLSIFEDGSGNLWVGTKDGLNRYNRQQSTWARFYYHLDEPQVAFQSEVTVMFEDAGGRFWLGTSDGLKEFSVQEGRWTHYRHDPEKPDSISQNTVTAICGNGAGQLWVGSQGGLNLFNPESGQFRRFTATVDSPDSISDNRINSLFIDRSGILWIGTMSGLNRYNQFENTFSHYRTRDGLPDDSVFAIMGDDEGSLWLSTNRGLSKFNPASGEFLNFNQEDGLQGDVFNRGSSSRGGDGEMYFGGINGFNSFHPDSIMSNPYIPQVVITEFQVLDEPVPIGPDSLLTKHIGEIQEIVLSHREHTFSFSFAALHYSNPEKNQYAYTMEGFDNKWTFARDRRFVSYTNLDPGHYTFRVRASNNNSVWNEEGVAVKIQITPPYWETLWFRLLVGFIVVSIAFTSYKLKVKNLQKQKKRLEIQVAERTRELREKNEQIMSSIQYAERIQNAVLPLKERISQLFPDFMIIYKPRDIVSGDFYWFSELNDQLFLVVADCTGHGVPGAFMSMIGHTLLNETINEKKITDPSKILERIHRGIQIALKQEGENIEATDGMDICLCRLDASFKELVFAGAKRPLYLIRKNGSGDEMLEIIKGDRKSIGGRQKEDKREFTDRRLSLGKGDMVYLTTDGLVDQSGTDGKKFGSKRFKQCLIENADSDMAVQKNKLLIELEGFQGEEEQRDDITVLGFSVPE